jgi:hypothetical protein
VRFAAIGDSGSGDKAAYETAAQLERFQHSMNFTFVITLGDNLLGGSSSPGDYEKKFYRPYKTAAGQRSEVLRGPGEP